MKLWAIVAGGLFTVFSVTAGTINYEDSSAVGKFIADADKVYAESTLHCMGTRKQKASDFRSRK